MVIADVMEIDMADKSKTWGGSRPGAGRPPQTFTLRRGQAVGVWLSGTGGQRATVDIEGKGRGASLVLKLDNGDTITIDR